MEFNSGITQSFTEDFFHQLEYHLSRTFRNSSDKELKRVWCDGILMPDINQLLKKSIIDKKQILTKAWIGFDGQGKFEVIIKLGPQSFENCIKGLNLKTCLPSDNSLDWVTLNMQDNKVALQLK